MYLLVTAQAGLHGRGLLLVAEGRRVGQGRYAGDGRAEAGLGQAQRTEER